jgi:hypothetical protein
MTEHPEKLTETEARGGSKTLANRNVMIISVVILVILFVGVYAYFA